MHGAIRARRCGTPRQARKVTALATIAVFSFVGTAYAFYDQYYGGYNVCGTNGCGNYVQSSGSAHTYVFNATAVGNGGAMSCQLFNYSGYNYVKPGVGQCVIESANPSIYKWARGYNQSGQTAVVSGYARTN